MIITLPEKMSQEKVRQWVNEEAEGAKAASLESVPLCPIWSILWLEKNSDHRM